MCICIWFWHNINFFLLHFSFKTKIEVPRLLAVPHQQKIAFVIKLGTSGTARKELNDAPTTADFLSTGWTERNDRKKERRHLQKEGTLNSPYPRVADLVLIIRSHHYQIKFSPDYSSTFQLLSERVSEWTAADLIYYLFTRKDGDVIEREATAKGMCSAFQFN